MVELVPVQMWAGRSGMSPVRWSAMSAVPKRRCGLRVEPCQARTHTALRCTHTALQRMPLRATAGGAMHSGAVTLGVLKDHSRGALGRCNRLCWDATGNNAAMQQAVQWRGGRGTPVCARAWGMSLVLVPIALASHRRSRRRSPFRVRS